MKLILTYCIRFIVTWDSLRFFIIRFTDYKRKLPQVTINRIQNVKICFIPAKICLNSDKNLSKISLTLFLVWIFLTYATY